MLSANLLKTKPKNHLGNKRKNPWPSTKKTYRPPTYFKSALSLSAICSLMGIPSFLLPLDNRRPIAEESFFFFLILKGYLSFLPCKLLIIVCRLSVLFTRGSSQFRLRELVYLLTERAALTWIHLWNGSQRALLPNQTESPSTSALVSQQTLAAASNVDAAQYKWQQQFSQWKLHISASATEQLL